MKKFLLSILSVFLFVLSAQAVGNEYKNILHDMKISSNGNTHYDVVLKTEVPYPDEIKIIKKSDNSYYLLLAETYSALKSTKGSGLIRDIRIETYPYAEQNFNNGYTKISFSTSAPIDFNISLNAKTISKFPIMDMVRLAKLEEMYKKDTFDYTSAKIVQTNVKQIENMLQKNAQTAVKQATNTQTKLAVSSESNATKQTYSSKTPAKQVQTPKQNATEVQTKTTSVISNIEKTAKNLATPTIVKVAQTPKVVKIAPKITSNQNTNTKTAPKSVSAPKISTIATPIETINKQKIKKETTQVEKKELKKEVQTVNKISDKKISNAEKTEKSIQSKTLNNNKPATQSVENNSNIQKDSAKVEENENISEKITNNIAQADTKKSENDFLNKTSKIILYILIGIFTILINFFLFSKNKKQNKIQNNNAQHNTQTKQNTVFLENEIEERPNSEVQNTPEFNIEVENEDENTFDEALNETKQHTKEVYEVEIVEPMEVTETEEINNEEELNDEINNIVDEDNKDNIFEPDNLFEETSKEEIAEEATNELSKIKEIKDEKTEIPEIETENSETFEIQPKEELQEELEINNDKNNDEIISDIDINEIYSAEPQTNAQAETTLNENIEENTEIDFNLDIGENNLDIFDSTNKDILNTDKEIIENTPNNTDVSLKKAEDMLLNSDTFIEENTEEMPEITYQEEEAETINEEIAENVIQEDIKEVKSNDITHTEIQKTEETENNVQKQSEEKQIINSENTEEEQSPYSVPFVLPKTENVKKVVQVNKKPIARIIRKAEISNDMGLYLAEFKGTTALVGYIDDDIFILHNFRGKKLANEEILFRLSESRVKEDLYYVMVDDFKFILKTDRNSMSVMQKIA